MALFILSLVPRFYDIWKFLPYYSIDENEVVEYAVAYSVGSYEPFFLKYGPLYSYFLSFCYSFMSFFSESSQTEYMGNIFFHGDFFYYFARATNSIINILMAVMVYKVARLFFSKKVAKIALLISIIPFFDMLANFKVRIDTLLSMFNLLSLYFTLRISKKGKIKDYIFSGLFFGLGLATKPIPSLLVLPTIFLGHLFFQQKKRQANRHKKENNLKLWYNTFLDSIFGFRFYFLLAVGILSNAIYNPYLFIKFDAFYKENIQAITSEGQRNFQHGADISRFFGNLGYLMTFFSIAALIFTIYYSIKKRKFALLLYPSLPIVIFSAFSGGASRTYFYIAMLPPMFICVAFLVDELSKKIVQTKHQYIVVIVLVFTLTIQPVSSLFSNSFELNYRGNYKGFHSSFVAKKWIEENISENEKLLLVGEYTLLPMLFSSEIANYGPFKKDVSRGSMWGQFFYYGRLRYDGFRDLFGKAFLKEIKDDKQAKYHQMYFIRKNQASLIKLLDYGSLYNSNMLITTIPLEQGDCYEKKLIKVFSKDRYPFGVKISILDIKMQSIEDAVELPVSIESHYFNALLFKKLNLKEKALLSFSECIKLEPSNVKVIIERANLFFDLKNYKKAGKDFNRVVTLNPNNTSALYNLGICFLNTGETQKGIEFIKKAKRLGNPSAKTFLEQNQINK